MAQVDVMFKHVCKFCSKCFPCGRSLGGHIRSHMINSSPTSLSADHHKLLIKENNCGASYELRGNPRRTWRVADLSSDEKEDALLSCRECGKVLHSSKALFAHMKSHSYTNIDSNNNYSLVDDSENEESTVLVATTRDRLRTSNTRRLRYMGNTTTSTSPSIANNISSSVSEIEEHEEVEVALCLIMLSRDVGQWEVSDHRYVRNDQEKMSKHSVEDEIEVVEARFRKELSNNLLKRKQRDEIDVFEVRRSASKVKRSRFECATCGKVFNSFQALGGHRASHKKIKACSFLKPENSNNSLDTELFPLRSTSDLDEPVKTINGSKKAQKHECPICFRVFLSGQALGGHKRSHVMNGSEATSSNHQSIVIQKPSQDIHDFLDLNLPAAVEHGAANSHGGFKPWWQEPLLSLI